MDHELHELHELPRALAAALRVTRLGLALALLVGLALVLSSRSAGAFGNHSNICTKTSGLLLSACKKEVSDGYLTARAVCLNLTDPEARQTCNGDAVEEQSDGWSGCFH